MLLSIELFFYLSIALCILLGIVAWYANLQVRSLKQHLSTAHYNKTLITDAIEEALLLIEENQIIWMSASAKELFGNEQGQTLSSILYDAKDIDRLLMEKTIRCHCLGLNDYLFVATLKADRQQSIKRWVLRLKDETFQPQLEDIDLKAHSLHSLPKSAIEPREDSPYIVIVDDDDSVLETYRDMISYEGWHVKAFTSGKLAVAHIRSNPQGVDLIITDYKLREMTGVDVIQLCRQYAPQLNAIVMSGFSLSDPMLDNLPFLQKPCARHDLISSIQQMLDQNPKNKLQNSL